MKTKYNNNSASVNVIARRNSLSDEQLVARFIGGDESAFNGLLSRCNVLILGVIRNRVGSNSYVDVDDVFQDVTIKIYESLRAGKYSESSKFKAWALTIAAHKAVDAIRHVKELPLGVSDDDDDDRHNCSVVNINKFECSDDDDLARVLELEDRLVKLNEAISLLNDDQRSVVLARLQGVSFKDFALSHGISINTALGWMNYAKCNLRKSLLAA